MTVTDARPAVARLSPLTLPATPIRSSTSESNGKVEAHADAVGDASGKNGGER